MADLSHLGGLNPVEALDFANYADNKESTFRLPPARVYTLQAPDSFPQAAITRTKKGDLQFQIDPTITEEPFEGFTVRFVKVSAKTFARGKGTVSQVGDYLRACGFNGSVTNEQELADAVEATAGTIYRAKLDWRAYNKRTGWSVEGMERFPKLKDGSHQSWIVDPSEVGKDVNGNPIVDAQGNPIVDETTGQPRRQARVLASLYIPLGGFVPAEG